MAENNKNVFVGGILNFFLLGAGYIYQGKKPIKGILMTLGAIIATYVEFQLMDLDMTLWGLMFGAVFLLALGTTYDIVTDIRADNDA